LNAQLTTLRDRSRSTGISGHDDRNTHLSFATAAMADGPTCAAGVAEKKLAGAAKASFMKKCETDAKATCERVE
jgi:hypothetical protein